MPRKSVRTTSYTRSGYTTRSRFRPARSAAIQFKRTAMNAAKRGLQLSRGEWKSIDTGSSSQVDTTTAVALVNGCARGDDINERTGRSILMRSVLVRLRHSATESTGSDQFHRVLLVYDRQANAAALTAAQVLTAATVDGLRNLENRNRFKILMDRTIPISSDNIGAVEVPKSGSIAWHQFYRKLRHPVTFNSGDAGTVADITSGSLYLVFIGSIAAGVNAGTCTYSVRVRYEDK